MVPERRGLRPWVPDPSWAPSSGHFPLRGTSRRTLIGSDKTQRTRRDIYISKRREEASTFGGWPGFRGTSGTTARVCAQGGRRPRVPLIRPPGVPGHTGTTNVTGRRRVRQSSKKPDRRPPMCSAVGTSRRTPDDNRCHLKESEFREGSPFTTFRVRHHERTLGPQD